jgi:diguanylate cyclase (GGDEF)-like protein
MDTKTINSLLIVDDDKSKLAALSDILKIDYTVHVASDGASAIRTAEEFMPDLVLLDIIMPDMDGFQVFDALRTTEKTSDIPVILITEPGDGSDLKKGLQLGAVDYISKPFDDMIVKLRVRHQIQIINLLRTIGQLSTVDQLTNIPNRRSFDDRLKSEWGRAVRENLPLCLLMIDIDHFKSYNETYGHQQGDKALNRIAQVINQTIKRSSDFAARWRGEEFVVLLPNLGYTGGLAMGESIRERVEETEIPCDNGDKTKLTISIGVNAYTPTSSCVIDNFILGADNALSTAKNSGRNKVCLYE